VDLATLDSRLQTSCCPLKTLSKEMLALQQGCTCVVLDGAKKGGWTMRVLEKNCKPMGM
jgi:hypothetical protein